MDDLYEICINRKISQNLFVDNQFRSRQMIMPLFIEYIISDRWDILRIKHVSRIMHLHFKDIPPLKYGEPWIGNATLLNAINFDISHEC